MKKTICIILIAILTLVSVVALTACDNGDGGVSIDNQGIITVTIGASSVPHAEILEYASTILLKEQGIKLDIVVFDDYVTPNTALSGGDIFANYFQHIPYMNSYNANSGAIVKIVDIVGVHLEPLGIYKGGKATGTTLESIRQEEGAKTIVFTNDPTNQARALNLLAAQGLITKKASVTNAVTVTDYEWGTYVAKAIDPETLVALGLPDCHLAVIPGNFALTGGITTSLATENPRDADIANNYVNVVAVRVGCENTAISKAIAQILSGEQVSQYILTTYHNAVIPAMGG